MQRKLLEGLKIALLLVIVASCLFGYALRYHSRLSSIFCIVEVLFLRSDTQWLFSTYLSIWCASFLILKFNLKDIWLIALLLIGAFVYTTNYPSASQPANAVMLVAGITFGKGMCFLLKKTPHFCFILSLVLLLVTASWCHLGTMDNFHRGPRWTGLWDNPNTYGMFMGTGVVLATGLLMLGLKKTNGSGKLDKTESERRRKLGIFLGIAIFMLGFGLMMSYSRGAWLATGVGLLYLAWCYGRLKWKYAVPGFGLLVVGILLFWSRTPDSAPWYVKRADLGRPSAQHRVSAWRAGVEIMRDHPFGVGWNKAVSLYDTHYSPPEGGAAALTTNDYMMVGTELGIPALLCFVTYVGLCYWKSPKLQKVEVRNQEIQPGGHNLELEIQNEAEVLRAACLAGALVFVVAFWFDGGLFKLATASVFWVLLELGSTPFYEIDRGNRKLV